MERKRVIVSSKSSWASPIVFVKKFCVDYCLLNSVTKIDSYPLTMTIRHIAHTWEDAKCFQPSILTAVIGKWNCSSRIKNEPYLQLEQSYGSSQSSYLAYAMFQRHLDD
ncbi:hypothetical protein Trydic_g22825 [Trypoxylus dichotomus]